MCIRDEEDVIEDNLRCHHHLGVERAYVFLDQSVDRSREILDRMPWVTAIEHVREGNTRYNRDVQNPCAARAMEMALADGFDWLMHVDADEYAWGDNPGDSLQEQGDLIGLVGRADPATEQVHMRCREAISVRGAAGRGPWEQCYFQDKGQLLERDMLNPATGRVQTLKKWVGHNIGKSIVRVTPDMVPVGPHRWGHGCPATGSAARPLVTEELGLHAHYITWRADLWQQKFRGQAWTSRFWPTGQEVPFPKQAWKESCPNMSPREAEEYFDRWIAVDRSRLDRAVGNGEIVHDTRIRDTVALIRSRRGAPAQPG